MLARVTRKSVDKSRVLALSSSATQLRKAMKLYKKAKLIFTPEILEEIFLGVYGFGGLWRYVNNAHRFTSLKEIVYYAESNFIEIGLKCQQFRDMKHWREMVNGHWHMLRGDYKWRDQWLKTNHFEGPFINEELSAIGPTDLDFQLNGPYVYWIQHNTGVIISSNLYNFGVAGYTALCGPILATRNLLTKIRKESSYIKNIEAYSNGLATCPDEALHTHLLWRYQCDNLDECETPDKVFDPTNPNHSIENNRVEEYYHDD